jgi:hypothetical protein
MKPGENEIELKVSATALQKVLAVIEQIDDDDDTAYLIDDLIEDDPELGKALRSLAISLDGFLSAYPEFDEHEGGVE